MDCLLKGIPLLRYLKDPAAAVDELYGRYPRGGQTGWFAFVKNEKNFAYWDADAERWKLLLAEEMKALEDKITGGGGSGSGEGFDPSDIQAAIEELKEEVNGIKEAVDGIEEFDDSGILESIEALELDIEDLRNLPVRMVNSVRGCFNISGSDRHLYIDADVYLYVRIAAVREAFRIKPASVVWTRGSGPEDDTYFVLVDLERNEPDGDNTIRVVSKSSSVMPIMGKPVVVGAFHVKDGNVQGLSFCSDDVKVNGRYIYDNPTALGVVGGATLVCPVRGGMDIDTAGKVVTLDGTASLLTDDGRFDIPSGSYAWNKGNALDYYESIYTVYAVVNKDNPSTNSLAVVSLAALFIAPVAPAKAYRVGAFYWTGSEVGGISFGNDVFVDGAYIYGGSSGGGSFAYVNLLDVAGYVTQSQLNESSGDITVSASMDSNITGNMPIDGGARYVLDGVAQATNPGGANYGDRLRIVYYDDAGNKLKPLTSSGTVASYYYLTVDSSTHYMEMVSPAAAVRCVMQLSYFPGSAGDGGARWLAVDNDPDNLKFYRKP
jgi:hypothetical protein